MAKKKVTVAKNPKGKGYVVNYGGKKHGTAKSTKAAAKSAANKLRKKKGRK